ncbi:MAG: hypothetical protein K8I30_09880 [Anaerolineae bacterium]|nr:hypothetical protein [Anaerolineae bacterium]
MSDAEMEKVDEIWVSTGEGVEFTGYNQQYLRKLALKMSRLPDEERLIRVRNRAGRHELWLPDLVMYMKEHGYGPHNSKESNSNK